MTDFKDTLKKLEEVIQETQDCLDDEEDDGTRCAWLDKEGKLHIAPPCVKWFEALRGPCEPGHETEEVNINLVLLHILAWEHMCLHAVEDTYMTGNHKDGEPRYQYTSFISASNPGFRDDPQGIGLGRVPSFEA